MLLQRAQSRSCRDVRVSDALNPVTILPSVLPAVLAEVDAQVDDLRLNAPPSSRARALAMKCFEGREQGRCVHAYNSKVFPRVRVRPLRSRLQQRSVSEGESRGVALMIFWLHVAKFLFHSVNNHQWKVCMCGGTHHSVTFFDKKGYNFFPQKLISQWHHWHVPCISFTNATVSVTLLILGKRTMILKSTDTSLFQP
jgi:hypothetical protein